MTEQFEKKMSEEEEVVVAETVEPKSEPTEPEQSAVDTGRKVDVSKVVLKKNMVRTVAKKDDSEPEHIILPKPVTIVAASHSEPRTEQPRRRPNHNNRAKPKQKEIEVVRRPHLDNAPAVHAPVATKHEQDTSHVIRPEPTEWDDSGDFGAMLDASAPITKMQISIGDRVHCKLIHVAGETAFFSFESRYEGSMPLAELRRENGDYICLIGDEIDTYVIGLTNGILLSLKMGKNMADLGMLEEAKTSGIPVEGTITGVNAGGYDVAIGGARGFCPLGQIDVEFIEDPKQMIGRTLVFLVAKLSEGGRNIVLNRRKLLERERKLRMTERLKTLKAGDRVEGKVVRLADFGAFVDLNGVEGLVPNSELGHSRVHAASDRVSIGDIVQVEVLRIEADPKREGQMRIGLSLKAAMPDPYSVHGDKIVPGQTLEGKVARLETFGAFIELFDGIDGLIHISELSDKRISHPSEVLKPGDPVTVRVLDIDFEKRRVSLSLRENVERERDRDRDQPRPATLNRGAMVEGIVERIERYGVFLKLANGQTALLPASETGTPRGADLAKFYELGSSQQVMVIEVDDRGRVRVSKMAREQADERAVYETFSQKQNKGAGGFGKLGDLLSKMKVSK